MTDERNDNTQQPYDQQGQPAGREGTSGRRTEEFRVSGESVLAKIKELVHEGNVRRITIKNDEGRTLIEIPLTLGVIGTVLLPVWAAIGAIAAMAANLTIAVERSDADAWAGGTTGQGQASGYTSGQSMGQTGTTGTTGSTTGTGGTTTTGTTGGTDPRNPDQGY